MSAMLQLSTVRRFELRGSELEAVAV